MKLKVGDEVYDFDANKLMVNDAIALFDVTGQTVTGWHQGLRDSDPRSLKALAWLASGKATPFAEFDFDLASLEIADDEGQAPDPTAEPSPNLGEGTPSASDGTATS